MIDTTALLAFLWEVTVRSTVLLALTAAAVHAARKASPDLRHRLWAYGLAGAALLPIVILVAPRVELPLPYTASGPQPNMISAADRTVPPAADRIAPPSSAASPIRLEAGLLALYAGGVAASVLGLALALRRLRGLERRAGEAPGHHQRALGDIVGALGISPPTLRLADAGGPAIPMTWGLRRPVLLLPQCAAAWSDAYLRCALAHEAAHIRRSDWAVQIAARAVCSMYWFHPLARWAVGRLRLEAERACDEMALLVGIPAADYAACLLEVTRMSRMNRQPSLATLPMAHRTAIEERLRAILDPGARRVPRRDGAVMAIGTLLLVLATGALQATPPGSSAKRSDAGGKAGVGRRQAPVVKVTPATLSVEARLQALRERLRAAEAEVRRLREVEAQAVDGKSSPWRRSGGDWWREPTQGTGREPGISRIQPSPVTPKAQEEEARAQRALAERSLALARQQQLAAEAERARAEAQRDVAEAALAHARDAARKAEADAARSGAREALNPGPGTGVDVESRLDLYERSFRAQTAAQALRSRYAAQRDLEAARSAVDEAARSAMEQKLKQPQTGRAATRTGGADSGGRASSKKVQSTPRDGAGAKAPVKIPVTSGDPSSREVYVVYDKLEPKRGGTTAEETLAERIEELQDEKHHVELDIAVAGRRIERARARHKAGLASVEEVEDAELRLRHLELNHASIQRRMNRLKAPAPPKAK